MQTGRLNLHIYSNKKACGNSRKGSRPLLENWNELMQPVMDGVNIWADAGRVFETPYYYF